jgi:hypothetical protein
VVLSNLAQNVVLKKPKTPGGHEKALIHQHIESLFSRAQGNRKIDPLFGFRFASDFPAAAALATALRADG